MERAVLLRYHEIALKGGNRAWFEERLGINARRLIRRAVGKEPAIDVSHLRGRLIVKTPWNEAVRGALGQTFGLASFSPMRTVATDKEAIRAAALEEFSSYTAKHGLPRSFRVLTRRSDKAVPETSMELDYYVGSAIKTLHPGLEVDLKAPEFTVGVEIHFNFSYIWLEKIPGLGGLPVGTTGHLLSLLSGGLDSPVAAIQVLKRGATTDFLHFFGAPFVGPEVLEKVEDLARIVNRYQPEPLNLHVVPFGKIQEKIALATNPKMRTILYRRMMVRVADQLARKLGAQALVTGESLGQVASQTLENLATIDSSATMPILRPLITFDKDEIIEQAHRWGTFETAVRPGADCCTLFADRHPTIRSTIPLIEEQEAKFPWQELVNEALAGVELRRL